MGKLEEMRRTFGGNADESPVVEAGSSLKMSMHSVVVLREHAAPESEPDHSVAASVAARSEAGTAGSDNIYVSASAGNTIRVADQNVQIGNLIPKTSVKKIVEARLAENEARRRR